MVEPAGGARSEPSATPQGIDALHDIYLMSQDRYWSGNLTTSVNTIWRLNTRPR
jgi:hypothetical protein